MTRSTGEMSDALTVQQIADAITNAIREGRLAPGQRLTEIDFAKKLDVSRPSVREAFRQLTSDGLLHSQPYRGVSVRHMTRREVDDLFTVRGALEGLAVRLATPALAGAISPLEDIQTALDAAEASRDLNAMSQHNLAFHMLFADVSKNELLREQLRRIANNVYWLQFRVLVADEKVLATNATHRDLLEAVRANDPKHAEAIMIAHVDQSRQLVQALSDDHFANPQAD
ncbi:GntR family transcriptional regulator [Thalassospira profundimaris]|uniref:GntR family transcriptional regulator n=1 Tax=Thalassospira profundimaris TaxID=502049 RepID=A0A367WZQ5_9PROT|nr:GntR family transcriptional regulator [Thalassospira profundimaris]RCK46240.1 GntR family transcriptional regulator [Thalassospira profundimaris]